jgi:hypothetical protein
MYLKEKGKTKLSETMPSHTHNFRAITKYTIP